MNELVGQIEISNANEQNLWGVGAATLIGTAIEVFDFLAYGTAAALVFNKLFFPNLSSYVGTLAAFGAFASGLFARPLGGIVFGHLGDRFGRKSTLTYSMLLMGIFTVLIGLLPTYKTIGITAAYLLVFLRIAQGLAFGGELGGAMVMAVEHAPKKWKSLFGSMPQLGTPIGILLSIGAFALVTKLPEESFLTWGWRIPFLASSALIAIGIFIRIRVKESPEFLEVKHKIESVKLPLKEIILKYRRQLILTIFGKLGEVTLIYTLLVFAVSFAVQTMGFSKSDTLHSLLIAAVGLVVTTPVCGWLADKFGARKMTVFGGIFLAIMSVPLFMAIGSGSLTAFTVAVFVAMAINYPLIFAPESNLYCAQFPPELRNSGVSVAVQLAAALGGGLAPIIALVLVKHYSSIVPMGFYIAALGVLTTLAAYLMSPATNE